MRGIVVVEIAVNQYRTLKKGEQDLGTGEQETVQHSVPA
jgi:hypothetical protein